MNLKKQKGLNILTKVELKNVFAGTQPDCEDGFVPDGNGGCVRSKTVNSGGTDPTSPNCDTP